MEINSKFGYLYYKPIYNLSLLNDQDIKEHLLELVPEVIFFFNCDSNTKAFVFSMTGELAINEKILFNKYEKMNLIDNYDKKDKYNAENISMTIARYFLHEESGHFKFRNKTNIKNKANSLIKCISEGRIKSLTYFIESWKAIFKVIVLVVNVFTKIWKFSLSISSIKSPT